MSSHASLDFKDHGEKGKAGVRSNVMPLLYERGWGVYGDCLYVLDCTAPHRAQPDQIRDSKPLLICFRGLDLAHPILIEKAGMI